MRVFVAIDLDTHIRAGIGTLQEELQSKVDIKKGDVKWVKPEAMHLTLKFLGEVRDDLVAEVCERVEEVVARHKRFEIDIESVGYFGGRNARVLWVGTGEGTQALCRLQKDIEAGLSQAGWKPEKRKFTGHLTLCRIRNPKAGAKMVEVSQDFKQSNLGTLYVESVNVFESQLTPSGAVYTVLGSYELE